MKSNVELESRMVKYKDLLTINVKKCNEPLVKITEIPGGYLPAMSDMRIIVGDEIWVRKSVNDRLLKAQLLLKKKNQSYSLYIAYGYRTREIQTMRFLKRLATFKKFYSDPVDLYEAIHRSVAVPTVAGHPTGGAIDLYIINQSEDQLDFGSVIYDYSNLKYYVFSKDITRKQKQNRLLLREAMMEVGFAPYDGEWWHFSYGDREWAFYYKKPCALYDQIKLGLTK